MQSKENFFRTLIDDVQSELIGYKLEYNEVTKNNGQVLHGVNIRTNEDLSIAPALYPVLYLDDFYQRFHIGAVSYNETIEKVKTAIIDNAQLSLKDSENIATRIANYNGMQSSIYKRVINYEANKDMLKTMPHKKLSDLAVVYRAKVFSDENGRGSIAVTKEIMKQWGVTLDTIDKAASENMKEELVSMHLYEKMKELMDSEDVGMDFEGSPVTVVLTTKDGIDGASCITDKEFLAGVSEKYFDGDDFTILPSSVHEVLAVKKAEVYDLEEYQNMVKEVNSSVLQPQDFLSNEVYGYDATKRQVKCLTSDAPVREKNKSR